MLKERIKQYYSVLKFKPYDNNYYHSLESLNNALNNLHISKLYDYFVNKYFEKADNKNVLPRSMDLVQELKNEMTFTKVMFAYMQKESLIGYDFKSNIAYELNVIVEELESLKYYHDSNMLRLKYINDVVDGVYDDDIDILESVLEGYEYDIIENKLIIRYPEIRIEEDEDIAKSARKRGFNIIKDTYLFIDLDLNDLKSSINLIIMKPSYNQIARDIGFPHINGGIKSTTNRFCFGQTPPDISYKDDYINNIIKIILYFDVYLRKKFTSSVYNNLVDNKFIARVNNQAITQSIPNNIRVYKRRFQGAYILDYEIDFEDNTVGIDDLGIVSVNFESNGSFKLSEFTFLFKGNYVKQQFDDNKIIDHQQIQSIIKNKIYATKQSKLLALYSFKKTIEKLVESEHHRGSGEEDQNTMYEDTISRMGRINTVALFRGRYK